MATAILLAKVFPVPALVNGSDTGEEFPRAMDGLTRFQRGQAFGNQAINRVELFEIGEGLNNLVAG